MNEDTYLDPTAELARAKKRIYALEMTIERFKKYDLERKAYYSESMQRLEKLEKIFKEISGVDAKKFVYRQLMLEIRLQSLSYIASPELSEMEYKEFRELRKEIKAISKLAEAKKTIKKLRNANDQLIAQLAMLKNIG